MSDRIWTLAPDDLGALWEDCPRCFYLAAAAGFPRPGGAVEDGRDVLIAALGGRRTALVAAGMPAGVVEVGQRSVQSTPLSIHVPDSSYRCVIRGALDFTLALDDATLGVLEVARAADPRSAPRTRRLHALAHALESAGAGKVSTLGVLLFEPAAKPAADGPATVSGAWQWLRIERDDAMFYGFLAEALALLERAEPPGGTPLCAWCVYRDASRRTGY
jgi:hypothetical protein